MFVVKGNIDVARACVRVCVCVCKYYKVHGCMGGSRNMSNGYMGNEYMSHE